MSGALANFTCLDELTQVIYQGISKFVVLSTVSDDKWDIYLGLAKSKGRWWHGFWTEKDVHHNFVCSRPSMLIDMPLTLSSSTLLGGDIYWSLAQSQLGS